MSCIEAREPETVAVEMASGKDDLNSKKKSKVQHESHGWSLRQFSLNPSWGDCSSNSRNDEGASTRQPFCSLKLVTRTEFC